MPGPATTGRRGSTPRSTAPEIDLDRVHALAKAMLGDATFDWPREGALSLKIARAAVAGVEAKQADVNMRIDANGIEIERLAIADFGGAALAVKGRIDTRSQSPRGALTLDLDARALDGVVRWSRNSRRRPRSSCAARPDALRRWRCAPRSRSIPARPEARHECEFKIDGRAGAFRVALQGDATSPTMRSRSKISPALGAAKVNLTGRLDADDGGSARRADRARPLPRASTSGRGDSLSRRTDRSTASLRSKASSPPARSTFRPTARSAFRTVPAQCARTLADLKVANANIRSPRPVRPVARPSFCRHR